MDTTSGIFIAGGFSPDLTHHVMHALGHRIWGFSPEAFDDPDSLAIPSDESAAAEMAAAVARDYPHVFAIAMAAGPGGCDEDFEFEFTLDLLLSAFENLHDSGWTSPQR